jgi:putative Ca2+/H+ antiporter (TMEM165/GDT1 family)
MIIYIIKMKYLLLLILLAEVIISYQFRVETKAETEINGGKVYQMSSAGFTVFVSGLGDKSFIITALMATKYNKFLVFISASAALVIMSLLSVLMGVMIPSYVPIYFIDIIAVIIFVIAGIGLILQGNFPNESQSNELDDKQILKKMEQSSFSLKGQFVAFFQIFIMIFSAELGDKSQISTIYLSSNFDAMLLFYSVSIAQIVLTILAVLGGTFISSKLSHNTLNIIAGTLFLVFGVVTLCMIYAQDYKLITNSVHDYLKKIRGFNETLIPEKGLINKTFLKKY